MQMYKILEVRNMKQNMIPFDHFYKNILIELQKLYEKFVYTNTWYTFTNFTIKSTL